MLFNPLFFKSPDVPGIKQNDSPSFGTKKTNYLFSEIIKILYNKNMGENILPEGDTSPNNKIEIETTGSDLTGLKKFINALYEQNTAANEKSSKKSVNLTVKMGNLIQFLQGLITSTSHNPKANTDTNNNKETNAGKVVSDILEKLKNNEPLVLEITNGNEHIQMKLENASEQDNNATYTQNRLNIKSNKTTAESLPNDVKYTVPTKEKLNKTLQDIQSDGSGLTDQVDPKLNKASEKSPVLEEVDKKLGQKTSKDIFIAKNDSNSESNNSENNSTVKVEIQYLSREAETVTNNTASGDLKKIIVQNVHLSKEAETVAKQSVSGDLKKVIEQSGYFTKGKESVINKAGSGGLKEIVQPGTNPPKEDETFADTKTSGELKKVAEQDPHISKAQKVVTNQSANAGSKKIIDQIPLAENIKEAVIKEEGTKNKGNQIVDNQGSVSSIGKNDKGDVLSGLPGINGQDSNSDSQPVPGFKKDESVKEITTILNSQGRDNKFSSANKSSNIHQAFREPTLKTVHQSEVINEISKFIKQGDRGNITLKLIPEKLGTIKITLDTSGKTVQAKLEVANDSVKQMVVQNIDTLRTSLAQQGIQLAGFSVSLTSQDSKSNKSYSSKRKSTSAVTPANAEDNEETDVHKNMGYNTYEYLA